LDEEYNTNIYVSLPAGNHIITITNAGNDWFYLDWVELDQVLPATYAGNWQPSAEAIGLSGSHESLVYVVSPSAAFPVGATNAALPVQHGQTVILTNWPAGSYFAEWYNPSNAAFLGVSNATAVNGGLTLTLPDFSEDLAAIVYPPSRLVSLGVDGTQDYQFKFNSETGGRYAIEESIDLLTWTPFLALTNNLGAMFLTDPSLKTNSREFFRAKQNQ
jgi:hypothetical protein